jgi:hypothetical protein
MYAYDKNSKMSFEHDIVYQESYVPYLLKEHCFLIEWLIE